jgi:DNA-3-methyladenine glycosylase
MHYCMNSVAHDGRHAGGILIRAVEPLAGVAQMERNRGLAATERQLARGPACVTAALGVGRADNGIDLTAGAVRLHAPRAAAAFTVGASARIGISQAADKPWRFFVCGHPAVSGPAKLNRCPGARGPA